MTFSGKEMTAIMKMALTMANADGHMSDEETTMISTEMLKFGVSPDQLVAMLALSNQMEPTEALVIISKMNSEQKKYVTAYLGTMIAADGKIDDSEMKVWSLISLLAKLPEMNIAEAIRIWTKQ